MQRHRIQFRLMNFDHPCLALRRDGSQFRKDFGRYIVVHVDDADGFVGILAGGLRFDFGFSGAASLRLLQGCGS